MLSAAGVPTRERLGGAATTAALSVLLLVAGPGPADAPAHLYRAMLVRDGALVWDNLWFGGQYPLASYSLLYYLPAAVVGNVPLVLAAAVASTVLFAVVARREFGDAATWPSRVFAVLASAPMFTGLYSYAVGFALMLGALAALQRRRRLLALVLATVTLGASPLAFGFLILVLAAFAIGRRTSWRAVLLVGVPVAALAGIEYAVTQAFAGGGTYPFHAANLAGLLAVCSTGALLARQSPSARPLVALYALWGAGSIVLYIVPTPLGDNWTRLAAIAFPLALLTAGLARWHPRWLAAVAVGTALAYNVAPYALLVPLRLDTRPQTQAFWAPAISFLRANALPQNRIEVVPTASHWESYLFPRLGYAIARGWYQQLDMATNPTVYDRHLTPAGYRSWLRRQGVRFVILPQTRLDSVAEQEGDLLEGGSTGLRVVLRSPTVVIYELARATPILTGASGARLLSLGHQRITLSVPAAGSYRLRVRYVPYYRVRPSGCILPTADGVTRLVVPRGGRFTVDVPESASSIWHVVTDGHSPCAAQPAAASALSGGVHAAAPS